MVELRKNPEQQSGLEVSVQELKARGMTLEEIRQKAGMHDNDSAEGGALANC